MAWSVGLFVLVSGSLGGTAKRRPSKGPRKGTGQPKSVRTTKGQPPGTGKGQPASSVPVPPRARGVAVSSVVFVSRAPIASEATARGSSTDARARGVGATTARLGT